MLSPSRTTPRVLRLRFCTNAARLSIYGQVTAELFDAHVCRPGGSSAIWVQDPVLPELPARDDAETQSPEVSLDVPPTGGLMAAMLSKEDKNLANVHALDEATTPEPATSETTASGNTFPVVPEHDAVTRRLQFQQKNDIKKEKAAKKVQKAADEAERGEMTAGKAPKGPPKGRTVAQKAERKGKGEDKGKQASKAGGAKKDTKQGDSKDIKSKKLRNSKRRAGKKAKAKRSKRAATKAGNRDSLSAKPEGNAEPAKETETSDAKRSKANSSQEATPEEPKSEESSLFGDGTRKQRKGKNSKTKRKGRKSKDAKSKEPTTNDSEQGGSEGTESKKGKRKAERDTSDSDKPGSGSEHGGNPSGKTRRKRTSRGSKPEARMDADCKAAMKHHYETCFAGYDHGCSHCLSDHCDDEMVDLGEHVSLSVYWTRNAVGLMVTRDYLRACKYEGSEGKGRVKQVMYFSGGPCTWANIRLAERWATRLAYEGGDIGLVGDDYICGLYNDFKPARNLLVYM